MDDLAGAARPEALKHRPLPWVWMIPVLTVVGGCTPAAPAPTMTLLATITPAPTMTPSITPTLTVTPTATPAVPPTPTPPGGGGKIAFDSDRDKSGFVHDIYVMNPDGSGVTRLTNSPKLAILPAWSLDGTRIAYTTETADGCCSEGPNRFDIYVMNADGSNQTRLAEYTSSYNDLTWSPDGAHIAFASWSDDNTGHDIYVMNADGTNRSRLTDNPEEDIDPSWSPDGKRILFTMFAIGGQPDIYVMNSDGANQTQLTDDQGSDVRATWSPDGARIAFDSDRADANGVRQQIYVMNADGSGVTQLTFFDDSYSYGDCTWSPDGTLIAFASYTFDDSGDDIYVMNADGSNVINLTNSPAYNNNPSWSPH